MERMGTCRKKKEVGHEMDRKGRGGTCEMWDKTWRSKGRGHPPNSHPPTQSLHRSLIPSNATDGREGRGCGTLTHMVVSHIISDIKAMS